jgi:nucleotide-binding universal stress UspA family protein
MSARGDRALDRAIMLARGDASKLVVLHVNNDANKRVESIRSQLTYDLGRCAAAIRIEEGDPVDVIHAVAREQASTLVIIGVTRSERLGRPTLGNTAEHLVRTVEQPLLLVTERPRIPYAKVAVAVDFSPLSMQSVVLAGRLFPQQPITVLHAFQPIAAYGAQDLQAHREGFRGAAEQSYADWLASDELPAATRQLLRPHIVLGEPATAVRNAVEAGEFDLVVLTTRGRGRIVEFFIGSVAKRMLAELPCDALLIRDTQLEAATAPARLAAT